MPYDYKDDFNINSSDLDNTVVNFSDSVEIESSEYDGETQTEYDVSFSDELSRSGPDDSDVNDIDYSVYLEDIISNQEIIITNQETLISLNTEIQNNGYRLYYFVGGLYVAFAIIIMIKFFKTFLF